jgi:hypothetical protein
MGRKKKRERSMPPSVPGMFKGGGGGRYVDDSYTITAEGLAYQQAKAEAAQRKRDAESAAMDRDIDALGDIPDSDDPLQATAVVLEARRHRAIRKEKKSLSPHPRVWLSSDRMTQTETSLRVAFHLVARAHVTSDVSITISGVELARTGRPKFPVAAYLAENGWHPETKGKEWRTVYWKEGTSLGLRLSSDRSAWRVVAEIGPGARVLVYTVGGTLSETRSRSEYGPLGTVVQRAMLLGGVGPDDLVLGVVPRSKRSRLMVSRYKENRQILGSGLSLCTVDRAGSMTGLPFPGG